LTNEFPDHSGLTIYVYINTYTMAANVDTYLRHMYRGWSNYRHKHLLHFLPLLDFPPVMTYQFMTAKHNTVHTLIIS